MKKISINKKSLKYGSLSTALAAVVIVAVILVNLIAVMLEKEYPINIDLTRENVFTMNEKTAEYISSLDETVNVFVMMDEVYFDASDDKDYRHAYYLLRQYADAAGDKIKVTFNEKLLSDSDFTGKFPSAKFSFGDVVVVYDSEYAEANVTNYRKFNLDDCFTTTEYADNTYDISKLEQTLTSAVMYLNSDNSKKIGLVMGHDGATLSDELNSLLKSNIYTTTSVDLATGDVPEDVAVLLILDPRTDFEDIEIERIDKFLENGENLGRSIMMFVSQNTPKLPKLEAVLEEWGIEIGDGIIYDKAENSYYGYNNYDTIAVYYNTDSNGVFSTSLAASDRHLTTPDARPITVQDKTGVGITSSKLINTYSTARLRASKAAEYSDNDEKNAYTVAAIATKTRVLQNKERKSSVMVCGSSGMLEGSLLTSASFSNDSGFIEMLNYCAGRDVGVIVSPKDITTATLDLEPKEQYWMAVVFIAVIPALIAIAGIAVNVRRRRL